MAAVNVTNVAILNNPALFSQPLQFEIQYECVTNLADGELHPVTQHTQQN